MERNDEKKHKRRGWEAPARQTFLRSNIDYYMHSFPSLTPFFQPHCVLCLTSISTNSVDKSVFRSRCVSHPQSIACISPHTVILKKLIRPFSSISISITSSCSSCHVQRDSLSLWSLYQPHHLKRRQRPSDQATLSGIGITILSGPKSTSLPVDLSHFDF